MRAGSLLAGTLLLVGCATRSPVLPELLPNVALDGPVELAQTPFFPQRDNQCGPAALATVLAQTGIEVTPDQLIDDVYVPARKGSLQAEMVATGRRHGRIPFRIPPSLAALVEEIKAGRPVLVLLNLGLDGLPVWHYAVVIGIDPQRELLILRSGKVRRKRMDAARFVNSWRKSQSWGVVLLRPGELPANSFPDTYLNAVSQSEKALAPEKLHKAYSAALARWPENLAARFGVARSLELNDKLTDADYHYRAILRQRPEHPVVLNNLALVAAKRGCQSVAEEAVKRALGGIPAEHGFRATVEDTQQFVTNQGRSRSTNVDCRPLAAYGKNRE